MFIILFLKAGNASLPKTIPALISSALSACDPDLRQVLLGNIVLTGGGSMLSGFADRLSSELQRNVSHVRIPLPPLSRAVQVANYSNVGQDPRAR